MFDFTIDVAGGPLDQIPDIEALLQMDEPHAVCPWHKYRYSLKTGFSPQGLRVSLSWPVALAIF